MNEELEPALRRLSIEVCQNCIDRVEGSCHMPGCFFIRWNIEDVPGFLEYYVSDEEVAS